MPSKRDTTKATYARQQQKKVRFEVNKARILAILANRQGITLTHLSQLSSVSYPNCQYIVNSLERDKSIISKYVIGQRKKVNRLIFLLVECAICKQRVLAHKVHKLYSLGEPDLVCPQCFQKHFEQTGDWITMKGG